VYSLITAPTNDSETPHQQVLRRPVDLEPRPHHVRPRLRPERTGERRLRPRSRWNRSRRSAPRGRREGARLTAVAATVSVGLRPVENAVLADDITLIIHVSAVALIVDTLYA